MGTKRKGEIMAEENDTKFRSNSERRQKDRRTGKDRRKVSIPVAIDRRKSQRRSGEDRRQKK